MLPAVAAESLGLGRRIDLWSLALLLVAIGTLAISPGVLASFSSSCMLVSVLAGVVQKYFSLRVALDAALFRRLADLEFRDASGPDDETLAALDAALAECGLIKPAAGSTRDLASRCQGAMRLLYAQAMCMAVQVVALVAAVSVGLS